MLHCKGIPSVLTNSASLLAEPFQVMFSVYTCSHYASFSSQVFNIFQLGGNFVSYMLDSVPLGRFCQRAWAPNFKDTWSAGDVGRYFTYTLPAPLFELDWNLFDFSD